MQVEIIMFISTLVIIALLGVEQTAMLEIVKYSKLNSYRIKNVRLRMLSSDT